MSPRLTALISALALLPAHAADGTKENRRYLAKPLMGDYYVYGGSPSDSTPPTPNDRKVSFMLTGPLAKELFDHLGKDANTECKPSPDYRERRRGGTLPVPGPKSTAILATSGSMGKTGRAWTTMTADAPAAVQTSAQQHPALKQPSRL